MKSMVRTMTAAALVGIAALGTLAACSSEPSSSATSASKDTSFTYWSSWNQNEPQAKVIQEAITAFTKKTGIKVDVQWQGRQVMTKLTPTLHTGAAADLTDGTVNGVGPLVSTGQDENLKPVYSAAVPGEGKTVGDVIPSSYTKWLKDSHGAYFMVPYAVASEAIWFDSAKNADLASSKPATWSEFTKALATIKSSGSNPIAMPSTDSYWLTLLLERELGNAGVNALATDKTGKAWDSPKVKDAAQKFLDLRNAGYFQPGYESNQGNQAELSWAAGEAALYLSGTWVPSETKPNVGSDFTYDSLQMPTINGGPASVGVNFTGFAVPKTAKHKQAAEEFIAFFMQKTWMQKMATDATQISPRGDVSVPKDLQSVATALKTGPLYPDQGALALNHNVWYTTVFQPAIQAVTVGKSTAAEFVSQAKQGTINYWKTAQ